MSEALAVFKALSDDTRLKLVKALSERPMYVEQLAQRLCVTPATVSFHLKKLFAAGLVEQKREQYYMMYSLRKEVFNMSLDELALAQSARADDIGAQAELREAQYRTKVLKAFMPDGYCETMPAQIKKRVIVFEEIIKLFEPGKTYAEREVNDIITRVHADYCSVRRAFIGMGWMTRQNSVYTVTYNAGQKTD